MAIKPILFNTEMVRATLDGRKTVTRRAVKCSHKGAAGFNIVRNHSGEVVGVIDYDDDERMYDDYTQPPYRPGDILYVRETFRITSLWTFLRLGEVCYKADKEYRGFRYSPDRYEVMHMARLKPGWISNLHMPREAARIFLRVTGVRVERLQEINMFGIWHEGVVPVGVKGGHWHKWQNDYMKPAWDSTIKPADRDKYGWAANPWVWVFSFERCEEPEGWPICRNENE